MNGDDTEWASRVEVLVLCCAGGVLLPLPLTVATPPAVLTAGGGTVHE